MATPNAAAAAKTDTTPKATAGKLTVAAVTPNGEQKKDLQPKASTDMENETTLPLDERLLKLDVLFSLNKKFLKLRDTKTKLQAFKIAADKESSTLEISDDDRNSFETKNPAIIAAVKELILKMCNEKEIEVGNQLVW